jgi:NAD(P)-dependent dehydrogenase (short-subunit alcohol dehydrogenase family)
LPAAVIGFTVAPMSLVSLVRGRRGASGFGYASTAEEVTAGLDLTGRTILVTGSNSGLGEESVRVLASRGARIIATARTREKAAEAMQKLGIDAIPVACELGEPASVRACVAEVKALGLPLDVLLCNAGVMALPKRELIHGHEAQFFTNHIGHFLLVTGLLDSLSPDARVVMLSSAAHFMAPSGGIRLDDPSFAKGYQPWAAYGQSKLANLLFARALARRFAGTKRTANAVHPGVIATNLTRHTPAVVRAFYPIASAIAMKDVHQGASTQCYVAVHPSVASVNGEYFADCNVARSSGYARDEALSEALWKLSDEIAASV